MTELGFDFWYTLILLVGMTVLLTTEKLEVEVTVLGTLFLMLLGGVMDTADAFSGFANEGVITIAAMFVVAGALNTTGILRNVSHHLFGRKKNSVAAKLSRLLLPVGALSAFVNNTPVVALLIPVVRNWAEKYGYPVSKFLMPISFAAILGGMCTLIGTSTNLIIHGLMIESGLKGLGLFEVSKIGIPIALAGIAMIIVAAGRFLPDRRELLNALDRKTKEFVIELKVSAAYPNLGKTVEEAGLRHLKGLFLFQIQRQGYVVAPAEPDERILLGDRLFFTGIPETILELKKVPGLELTEHTSFDLKDYDSAEVHTFECVISHGSDLVGKTVRDSHFRTIYDAVIIAIHRHGERINKKVGDIVLMPGDTLLVLAKKGFLELWYNSNDFYLIATTPMPPSKPMRRGYLTVALFVLLMVLVVGGVVSLVVGAGVVIMILLVTRTIHMHEMERSLNWRVLVTVAMTLGIARGVESSGVATVMADLIIGFSQQFGLLGVMSSIYLITNIYTLIITNNAAAAILFPIAISAARGVGADPRAFAMVVLVGAAASFATPISYQTNLMVYGPGGYKFRDFLRLGVPLQILTGVMAIGLVYWFYL